MTELRVVFYRQAAQEIRDNARAATLRQPETQWINGIQWLNAAEWLEEQADKPAN